LRAGIPIIDMCGTALDAASWRATLLGFARGGAAGYLHTFGANLTRKAGVSHDEYLSVLARAPEEAIDLLMSTGKLGVTAQSYALELAEEGIAYQVLLGTQTPIAEGGTMNDRVMALAQALPCRLEAWAGLDIADMKSALAEFERCVAAGAKGASIIPFQGPVDPDSRVCHELYGRAVELRAPIWIHTGMNFASGRPLHASTWAHIDRIAIAHPQLRIVVGHGGWPWIAEGMAVLQRHRNVYLEFSAHRARHMAMPGSGWEPLFLYGRGVVRNQIMFGSAAFVQSATVCELADEVRALSLSDNVIRAWLHDNAARLLGRPLASVVVATSDSTPVVHSQ
jgi:predicted TIM-barrel fold metal-dependent hydrolase